ncbi:MAG: hypothetical protein HQL01_12900 [Nitrospirae bacterium]|nr:hypothetical protein [Nitrospirota bacterium]
MEGKEIIKEVVFEALGQFVPQLVDAVDKRMEPRFKKIESELADVKITLADLRHEIEKRPEREELRFLLKQEVDPIRRDLTQKPDEERVRQIVREETSYSFVKVK